MLLWCLRVCVACLSVCLLGRLLVGCCVFVFAHLRVWLCVSSFACLFVCDWLFVCVLVLAFFVCVIVFCL